MNTYILGLGSYIQDIKQEYNFVRTNYYSRRFKSYQLNFVLRSIVNS